MRIDLLFLALIIGYLLGSVSFATLVAKRYGVDIFKAGSGNPGATNVVRVLGKGPGYTVFALDFLKGFIAAHWPMAGVNFHWLPADASWFWMGVAGLAGAVLGHSFSMFLRFRGGKGVATTIGGLLALMPFVILGGLLVWVVVFFASRYVSLASIAMGLALAPLAFALNEPAEKVGFCLVICFLIIARHRTNIERLLKGTEHKFEKKKSTAKDAKDAKVEPKGSE